MPRLIDVSEFTPEVIEWIGVVVDGSNATTPAAAEKYVRKRMGLHPEALTPAAYELVWRVVFARFEVNHLNKTWRR